MRLHLLGLPHTITRAEYSHCAFTGKVQRFAPMMRQQGYEVVHYGVEGAESGADEQVDVLSRAEQEGYLGRHDPESPTFVGDAANVATPLYRAFNARLRDELVERVRPGDCICLPFGEAHHEALRGPGSEPLGRAYWVETGIGYGVTFTNNRVYESAAWRAWHAGRYARLGSDYEWVVPNYFDLAEWEPSYERGSFLLYFGRIVENKGLGVVVELAKARPELDVVLCGQGDPAPWLQAPNMRYQPPVWGTARARLLRQALAVLCPTRYVEPFGAVAVEAQLTGTPVLASDHGAFPETVQQGVSGYRCHTLGDWLEALQRVERWGTPERQAVRGWAEQFDMHRIGPRYRAVFEQVQDLGRAGWYEPEPHHVGQASA